MTDVLVILGELRVGAEKANKRKIEERRHKVAGRLK